MTIIDLLSFGLVSSAIGGLLAVAYAGWLTGRAVERSRQAKTETLETRIQRLTSSLTQAAQQISDVELEVDSRRQLAEKLQADLATYNQLIELKKPEVEAIAQVLRGELRQEGRRSFWSGVAINFGFFVAGVVVTLLLRG